MRVESDGMLSVAAVLAESALRRPDHPAVVHEGRELRYGELWERARRHAAVLRAAGTRPGDRVALLLTDTPHFPAVYFGVLALGAVVVPVHPLLRAGQIAHVLRDSGARTLVCSAAMLPQALTAVRDATAEPGPPVVVFALDDAPPAVAGGPGPGRPAAGPHGTPPEPAGERTDGVPRIDLLAARAEPVEGYLPRAPGDVAVILYTSGTTGRPKGAALTHLNIVMNLMTTARSPFDMGPGDRLLGCLPLSHTFGQLCGMGVCFLAGATLVLMSRFEARRAVELMAAHDCTVFMGVPTMYLALLEAVAADPGGPRPRLDRAYSGGSALPVKVLEEVQEVFGCTVYEGYGLTETSPVVAYNQKAGPTRPGTVGRPVWGVEVGIARPDVEGRIELLPGAAVGEVVVRGHNVMAGYHGRPDATAEVLVDGWFRTGDLGRVDADGCLTIVDRKKDLVVRGGYNVYPREVEEVLVHHPAVARVAVIGVPDRVHGEEVCAVVVPGPGRVADAALAAEITAWARERIAAHQYPRRVEFLPELPLGISGKVLKRELAARFGS
ncbi:long-chain fatty acid--CoA ligase [Kitasatospora sp. RG8]|uniref:long-chain-fatty-acid--CoA ligase n=1 Tax=Kitasatospora sp. RG8 TaxID=2820815 RepID=UPI001FD797C0|nr:long-chain fatty acid--CoA ligase [Kitasatospora sp. RG8]